MDDYLEALYDDSLAVKVNATAKIAALAQRTDQLEPFLMHEALLGALARVLRDDGRRSVDLATNVLSVFFAFSHFSQLHQVISEHQAGDATMRLMKTEFKRTDLREKEGRPFSDIAMDAVENASTPGPRRPCAPSRSRTRSCTCARTCCSTSRRTSPWSAR